MAARKTKAADDKKKEAAVAKEATVAAEPKEEATKATAPKKKIVAKDIDLDQYITVLNGFHGKLVYKGRRNGEWFIWDEFGAEQDMELRELKSAKNDCKKFFSENLFMFNEEDMWVVDYLGLGKYYDNALSIDEIDDLFSKSAANVKKIVNGLSDGQKRTVAYRASQLIADGQIDSLSVINALEEALGTELIEH